VASRADLIDGSSRPGVGQALRRAGLDGYYQSIRLVPANLAWSVVFLAFVVAALAGAWLPILAAVALLAIPWLGIVRLTTQIVRGQDAVLSDVPSAWRRWLLPGLAAGAVFAGTAAILWSNVLLGVIGGGVVGWSLTTLAGWGLVLGWLFALCFWPILVDPAREGIGIVGAARLAGLLVLAAPLRLAGVGLTLALIAVVSTILFAAIVTVSAAFIALTASHFVLPAADELERHYPRR
jgi:hypothetical protein